MAHEVFIFEGGVFKALDILFQEAFHYFITAHVLFYGQVGL